MGGNIFDGTGPIKREHIETTLDQYWCELVELFPKKEEVFSVFELLGSAGKKDISGDIDLAFDPVQMVDHIFSKEAIESWGIICQDVDDRFEKLKKRARTSSKDQLMVKAFLQEIAKYINANSDLITVNEKKTTISNMFTSFPQYDENGNRMTSSVQIDWMVGDLEWLKFSYYSKSYEGNIKGLHRTQLMIALFDALGFTFNHGTGVKDRKSGAIVARNPRQALELISNILQAELDEETAQCYFELFHYIAEFTTDELFDKVIGIYFKILDRTRCDIPAHLQGIWIKRKNELGLTGKFLPEESDLKGDI
jgi:hypothetical protein